MRLAELIRAKESTKIDRIKRFNGRNRTICGTKSAKSTGLTLIRKFDRIGTQNRRIQRIDKIFEVHANEKTRVHSIEGQNFQQKLHLQS